MPTAHFYTWYPCMCEQPAHQRWLLLRRGAPSKGNPLRRAAAIPVMRVGGKWGLWPAKRAASNECGPPLAFRKQGGRIYTPLKCLVGISSQTLKTQKAPGFYPELFAAARPIGALVFSAGAWSAGEKNSESLLAGRDKTARSTAGDKEKIAEAETPPPRGFPVTR